MIKAKGVTVRQCKQSVKQVTDRLVIALHDKRATLYTIIAQHEELSRAGIIIPPMQFLLFGSPKIGGVVISENPMTALDLPLKILIWEDASGKVWIAFNDTAYIAERYQLYQKLTASLDLEPLVKALIDS